MEWIRVEERLPTTRMIDGEEIGVNVIIGRNKKSKCPCVTGRFTFKGGKFIDNKGGEFIKPTHWMSLPEPPK